MAPPRCFNRQDDIFLFFSPPLLTPSRPPSLSVFLRFLFFISSSPPLSLSALKGKYFVYAPSWRTPARLVPSLSPPPPPPLHGRPTNYEIRHLWNQLGRYFSPRRLRERERVRWYRCEHTAGRPDLAQQTHRTLS